MRISAIVLASLLSTATALGQGMPSGGSGGPPGGPPGDAAPKKHPPGNPADDALSMAEELRLQGRCDVALPILRGLAQGDGYDIPQYNLGLCLLDQAKSAPSLDKAVTLRNEGAVYILRAANAGLARAQAQAVLLYLDGTGVNRDPVEAQKWVLLYQQNAVRRVLGMSDLAQDLQDQVNASLDAAGRMSASARADAWRQTNWTAAQLR